MKKRALALVCALTLAGTSINLPPVQSVHAAQTGGTTYYISSIHGNNAKDGTSESAAWETLDKLIGLQLKKDRYLRILTFICRTYTELQKRRFGLAVMEQERKNRPFMQMDRAFGISSMEKIWTM